MAHPAPVHLHALAELRDAPSITVTWEVLTPIGPGWIGGGRTVQVWIGDAALDPGCPVYAALEAIVVAALAIPDRVEAACISGAGQLRVLADRAELDWEATASIPYGNAEVAAGVTRLTELDRALRVG